MWVIIHLPYSKYDYEPDAEFWESQWTGLDPVISAQELESSRRLMVRLLERNLPGGGEILDGGCGMGHWVIFLRRRGYQVVGLDFDDQTISRLRGLRPDIEWVTGNVLELPFSKNRFDAYISMGVLEHLENKFVDGILEAYRVLNDEGVFVLSVPFYSRFLRLLKAYQNKDTRLPFFQYYFTREELVSILNRCGFVVTEIIMLGAVSGVLVEIPNLSSLYSIAQSAIASGKGDLSRRSNPISFLKQLLYRGLKTLLNFLNESSFLRGWFAHMRVVVCRKRSPVSD